MNKKEILAIILLICVVFSLQAVIAADSGSNSTDSTVLSVDDFLAPIQIRWQKLRMRIHLPICQDS